MTGESRRGEGHTSFRRHRQQVWTQVLLPLILAALLTVVVIGVTCAGAFGGQGDVSRWAAISAIWLIIPGLLIELIAVAALVAAIYLISKIHAAIPPYSGRAQRIFGRVASTTKRGAEMVMSPSLAARSLADSVRRRFERRAWTRKA